MILFVLLLSFQTLLGGGWSRILLGLKVCTQEGSPIGTISLVVQEDLEFGLS